MIRINQIKTSIDLNDKQTEDFLKKHILKTLRISNEQLIGYKIVKKSIDARKGEVRYVYSVDVEVHNEKKIINMIKNTNVLIANKKEYSFSIHNNNNMKCRPVIVGSGPAGLFCGYMFAKEGYNPIIIERGSKVEERIKKINKFWNGEALDDECNVQFGEGGAGTFSDGKLNTMVKDSFSRGSLVLETFVKFGAPSEILYLNKPHIGTDNLAKVVKNMRNEIISLGGEVLFDTKMTDIIVEDNKIVGIEINHNKRLDTNIVVLAIGHSARDTFEMLNNKKINITKKAFAIGLRIEHNQDVISRAMYGDEYSKLGAADYKLTHQTTSGRGVYSFCMCPGGFVVNASSEDKRTVVNGMSNYKRDEKNANSALVVTVTPDDFEQDDPLAGVKFQRKWEKAAFKAGNGNIPVQLFGDFERNKESLTLGDISPNIKGRYKLSNLNIVLPEYVCEAIKEGVNAFEHKIKGYSNPEAVLSGVETRTSSPIRITRDENFEGSIQGLYPCGEGAGYAGGITSAAMDGIKVYEAIVKKYAI